MEREELIQSARKLYNSPWPNDALKKALEENYPELKESEDERIMKGLLEYFTDRKMSGDEDETWYGYSYESIIAFLEKQKENPKSVDYIPSDCASSAKCENEHNKPGDFVFELRQIISRHWYADMYSECVDDEEGMAREILSLCEKQKEQEPNPKYGQPLTEQWPTEEQLHNLNEAIKSFRMDGFERIADSLHSLYNILKTQRAVPAEKSVKDKTIEDVISYLNDGVHFNSPIAEMKYRRIVTIKMKKVNTCRDCAFRKRVEGHPRRSYCQMKVQKYHTGVKCFVGLKDVACEDFIKRDEI